jgi:hypothetical protein
MAIACLLAWVLPGGGHWFLGRRMKAVVFLALVLMTFFTGLVMQGRVYLANPEQPLTYLATFANVALGPLDLIGRRIFYERIIYIFPSESDPNLYQEIMRLNRAKILAVTHEYGTTFVLAAGLMNILLILDVFDIGIGRKR